MHEQNGDKAYTKADVKRNWVDPEIEILEAREARADLMLANPEGGSYS